MGLRSPQQLEQVKLETPNMPTVEAGKTSTLDLATPVKNFMEQKAMGEQVTSLKDVVVNRRNALSKIKSKYAVESVTANFKSRMAALAGNNAVTKSKGLFDEAVRGLEDLETKAPPELADQVKRDSKIKIQELATLMEDKIGIEGRKDAINTGNAVTKAFTDEASSLFEDKESFRTKYHLVHEYSKDTEAIKGGSKAQQDLNSAAAASNSVVEGVKFSLGMAATPDKVEQLSNYFEKDILKDGDLYVSNEDQTKIRNSFTAAKVKTANDLGYVLADTARRKMKKGDPTYDPNYTLDKAHADIFDGARGSGAAATQGNSLFKQFNTADKDEVERHDTELRVKVATAIHNGNPYEAEKLIKQMKSTKNEEQARGYLKNLEDGKLPAFSDPKHRAAQSKLWQDNPEAAAKVPMGSLYYSQTDRYAEEARRRNFGRGVYDKKYAIDNGSIAARVDGLAHKVAQEALGFSVTIDPKDKASISNRSSDIFAEVRDKYPNMPQGELMYMVEERMRDPKTGILKEVLEPNLMGKAAGLFGIDTSTSTFFNDPKTGIRPREDFKSPVDGSVRIVEPTEMDIIKFQDEMVKDGGKGLSTDKAREEIRKIRRAEAAKKNP